ncbi:MAG: dockerin type I repeat-containing protein [Chloroflexi bacterium]|nr:dockerin type I repeat-containing protein [Chloroflexota bacterium]
MPIASAVRRGFTVVTIAIAFAGFSLTSASQPANATEHVTGTWTANYSLACSASLSQEAGNVTGTVECGSGIMLDVEGAFDPGARTFSLSGEFDGAVVQIEGVMSSDGQSLTGTLSAPPLLRDGEFTGLREGNPDPANVAGLWFLNVRDVFAGHCSVDFGQTGEQVAGELACEDGPNGSFEGTFDSDTGELTLSGPFGEFGSLEMRLSIAEDGTTFDGIWRLLPDGPGGIMDGMRVMGGDASCDGSVDAVDAALVLQFTAGLLGSILCAAPADVDGDGDITSVDAALILQFTAGLLDSLPS